MIDRYNIDTHDYTVRLKAAKRFLNDGDKVLYFYSMDIICNLIFNPSVICIHIMLYLSSGQGYCKSQRSTE